MTNKTESQCAYCTFPRGVNRIALPITQSSTTQQPVYATLTKGKKLRIRCLDDDKLLIMSEAVIDVKYCPMCGKKLRS